ncbi:hypothetical protein ACFOGJ_11465 [Marinibaculum pumilum]|uniref:Uncharacterized protein n=1 Tax=Marinibaculum pumilum TaxID=1766165 RepID=A0ABV7KZX0_9PROT
MRDKRGKFVELAEARVNRTIKDIRLIGNLANKNAYTYSRGDVEKMFDAIEKELEEAKARFFEEGPANGSAFSLSAD